MSSPSYAGLEHGNGLPNEQYNSANTVNGTNSNSTSIDVVNETDSNPKSLAVSVVSSNTSSTLPTSGTISTISPSSSNVNLTTLTNGDDVCRDFLRNVCRRGKACRFKHPDTSDSEALARNYAGNFVFCHDYQNRECRRENCRFLHATKQEEELFRATGKLPPQLQNTPLISDEKQNSSTPICKDFVNGICRRGAGRCKFRHPTNSESFPPTTSPTNRNSFDGRNGQRGGGNNYNVCSPNNSQLDFQASYGGGRQTSGAVVAGASMMPSNAYGYGDSYENPNKRKRGFDAAPMYSNNGPYSSAFADPMSQLHGYAMQAPNQAYFGARAGDRSYLEEENAALRRRLDDLKKQVSDLMATNEYLMEQLNQYKRVQTAAAAAAAAPAAVAVATATSVASLTPQTAPPGVVSSSASIGITAAPGLTQSLSLQAQVPPPPPPPSAAAVIGPLPPAPSSIVSSIATISLPTVTAPVSLVNSSAAASLVSYTPALQPSTWPLGVDQ